MFAEINQELERKYQYHDFPLNIGLEITNHCNLNCIMCGNSDITRPRGYISDYLYKKVIEEVVEENPHTRVWLDFYGEAMLVGYRLYYLIDYAKKQGCRNVCINTNGTLLKKEYADMLLDSKIDYISLDCDGYSKEVFESIRCGSNRDVYYSNIEYLLEERNRRNSNTKIDVKVIEMPQNKHEIEKILIHWRKLGAWTAYRKMSDWVSWKMTEDEASNEGRIACGHAIATAAISWDGILAGCAWDGNCEIRCGNVNEESIKSIWNRRNEEIVKLHFEHRWNELSDFCRVCTTWKNIGEYRFDEYGESIERNYDESSMMYE